MPAKPIPKPSKIELARVDFEKRLLKTDLHLHTIECGEISRREEEACITVSKRSVPFTAGELKTVRKTLTELHDAHQTTHIAPALERNAPVTNIEIRLKLLKPLT